MDVAALAPTASSTEAGPVAPTGTTLAGELAMPTPAQPSAGLAPAISKLFGQAVARPESLNVSYAVSADHEIVIVFTDPATGKEVATFPPHLFAQLAEFLDHQQGAALDREA